VPRGLTAEIDLDSGSLMEARAIEPSMRNLFGLSRIVGDNDVGRARS
jgi:hypothetical protein